MAPERPRSHVNAVQLLASALAAAGATVVSTRFDLTGTVVGAVVASIVATAGSAVLASYLHRTNARLRRIARLPTLHVGTRAATPSAGSGWSTFVDTRPGWRRGPLPGLAMIAVVFALVLGAATGVESALTSRTDHAAAAHRAAHG